MILDTFSGIKPILEKTGRKKWGLENTGLPSQAYSRLSVVGSLWAAVLLVWIVMSLDAGASMAESKGDSAAGVQFSEQAAVVGLDFLHYNGMTGELYFPEMTGGSVALLDYDSDGDLDVYFGQGTLYFEDKKEQSILASRYPHPVTDRLYRNDLITPTKGQGELKFTDVTIQAGLRPYGNNMGVATGDFDNDGFVDLYLTNVDGNVLLRNQGDGTFEDVTEASKTGYDGWSVPATFLDYDRDGWLDLFVGNYIEFRKATVKTCTGGTGARDYCGPQSYPPLDNKLLRNKGDGTFEDVTIKALAEATAGSTLGLVSADFNDDGWIDIYVANDLMANALWLNQKDGTFVNDAMFSGAAVDLLGHAQASMGVVAGDLTGDGAEDLFMAHLAMEMNTFYVNDGTGLFRDGSRDSGLGMASWEYTGFGTALGDFNHDGLVDLFIGNGAVKRIEAQMRAKDKHPLKETNLLFRSSAPGKFSEVAAAERVDTVYSEVTRGVAVGDLDNDGALDLILVNNGGVARFLHNSHAPGGWVGLSVRNAAVSANNQGRYALGSRVSLHWKGGTENKEHQIVRRVRRDGSFASAGDPRVHFGIGGRSAPDWVEVL